MDSLSLEKQDIIKDLRNLFILKKDIRKLGLEKDTKAIKDTRRY